MSGATEPDPLVGMKVGSCRVDEHLASGGMGSVYRAVHEPTGRVVALKILSPAFSSDSEYITRFFREAAAAGVLDHPNVVRVLDVGKDEERYFLVMQYVPGETLDAILARERALPLERATRIVRDIASGLAAAHQAGISHRDVKPGNIIVTPEGVPRLTDFGLARFRGTMPGVTVEGMFIGTPEYASPEQVEGRSLDHRTDLYSLGVTYFQLLSGMLPFSGGPAMEVAIRRTRDEPRALGTVLRGADPRAAAVVARLLQREPGKRYASAADLIRDLESILAGGTPKGMAAPVSEASALASKRLRRRIRLLLFWDLAAAAVALGFFSGALADRGGALGMWLSRDSTFAARMVLAGLAFGVAAGAVLLVRKDMVEGRCLRWPLLLLPVMIFAGVLAGAMIERLGGTSAADVVELSVRALREHLSAPVNLSSAGLLCLFAAGLACSRAELTALEVAFYRVVMAAGFACLYAAGTVPFGLTAPFRHFMADPGLSFPLGTAAVLACVFGLLLLTSFGYEPVARSFGFTLTAGGSLGLYSFAVLVARHERDGGLMLVLESVSEMARESGRSGTALFAAGAAAVVLRQFVSEGIVRNARLTLKR
jgi:hypothetical protein